MRLGYTGAGGPRTDARAARGKLPKDYDKRLPVPRAPSSARKREPKLLAVIDPGRCFGRGCEYCIAVCPVPDCITLTTDPQAPELAVCTVNFDTCIGCMACEKWCPDDYDAIRMLPFTTVSANRPLYETETFDVEFAPKK